MVVDAAQSVPHMALDVRELGADFLAFSAHKALGPMGVGVLWGRMDLLHRTDPVYTGGEIVLDSVTEQGATWAPVPEKFEAGTQDAAGIYATGVALDYLVNKVGYETVAERERALVHYAMSRMVELPFVDIVGSIYWDQHHGAISFNVRGIHPHDVASIMDMDGVCIRAGHHCASAAPPGFRCRGSPAACSASPSHEDHRSFIQLPTTSWSASPVHQHLPARPIGVPAPKDPSRATSTAPHPSWSTTHIPTTSTRWMPPRTRTTASTPAAATSSRSAARRERRDAAQAAFTGHGCAISQASADIMAELITDETVEEAKRLSSLFLAMIRGEELSEEDFKTSTRPLSLRTSRTCRRV